MLRKRLRGRKKENLGRYSIDVREDPQVRNSWLISRNVLAYCGAVQLRCPSKYVSFVFSAKVKGQQAHFTPVWRWFWCAFFASRSNGSTFFADFHSEALQQLPQLQQPSFFSPSRSKKQERDFLLHLLCSPFFIIFLKVNKHAYHSSPTVFVRPSALKLLFWMLSDGALPFSL